LENIEISIGNQYNDVEFENKMNAIFKLENEDHTMGNLITNALQNNEHVVFAGFKKDHLLINEIIVRLETKDYNPLRCFFDTLAELKKIYTETIYNINSISFI
jgi:DNA-directed RNA polymerase I and III subunit RPAC2